MQKRLLTPVLMVTLLVLVVVPMVLAAAPPLNRSTNSFGAAVEAQIPAAQAGEGEEAELVTASVIAQLANRPGRAIVTARGNNFLADSPPLLGGPNEELNPVDLLLAALASCSTFVYETAAQEMEIPLEQVVATVEADFDPRGVRGEPVDPRMQAFRVHLAVSGATEEQAEALAEQWRQRCPIYTTLIRSAPIEIDITIDEAMAEPTEASEEPAEVVVEAVAEVAGGSMIDPLEIGDPERGREIFETGGGVLAGASTCSGCHSLDGTEKAGPSLQGISVRAGDRVPELSAVEYLEQSIVDPPAYVVEGFPSYRMPKAYPIWLNEEDIDNLVAFMLTE
jgi:putative redox protein